MLIQLLNSGDRSHQAHWPFKKHQPNRPLASFCLQVWISDLGIFPEFSWENSLLNGIQFHFYGPQALYQFKSICSVSSRNSLAFQSCWWFPFQGLPKTSLLGFLLPSGIQWLCLFRVSSFTTGLSLFLFIFSIISVGSWKEKRQMDFLRQTSWTGDVELCFNCLFTFTCLSICSII